MPEARTVLGTAEDLVYGGERNKDYGHPRESCQRIADLWNAAFNWTASPDDVAMALLLLKVSREIGKSKVDNVVDMAGYVGVYARVLGIDP